VLDEIREVKCHLAKVEHVIVLGNGNDRRAATWLNRTRWWRDTDTPSSSP
jgi:hypothetical protein